MIKLVSAVVGTSLLGNAKVQFEHTLEVEPADDSFFS
jgi:hypothetical protein